MEELNLHDGPAQRQPRGNDKSLIRTNEDEDLSLYRDLTCTVCYTSMAELAHGVQNSSSSGEESKVNDFGQKLSVANQCNKCLSILCHDCLVDWAVATIKNLHVPEAWANIDILKLKCSSQNCDQTYSVNMLMQILNAKRFEQVSLELSRRVMQSSE